MNNEIQEFMIIKRIIAAPFVLILTLIHFTYIAFRRTWWFILYGGEFINYEKKNTRHTIEDVYNKLKNET